MLNIQLTSGQTPVNDVSKAFALAVRDKMLPLKLLIAVWLRGPIYCNGVALCGVMFILSSAKNLLHLSFPGEGAETIERGSAGHVGETSPLQLGH